MDIRIGMANTPREVEVAIDADTSEEVTAAVEAALSGSSQVLWLTDKKGGRVAVAAERISYVEFESPDQAPGIGFGS